MYELRACESEHRVGEQQRQVPRLVALERQSRPGQAEDQQEIDDQQSWNARPASDGVVVLHAEGNEDRDEEEEGQRPERCEQGRQEDRDQDKRRHRAVEIGADRCAEQGGGRDGGRTHRERGERDPPGRSSGHVMHG